MHTVEPTNHEWHRLAYWIKHDIKRMFLGWDDFKDIYYYWVSILIAFSIAYVIGHILERRKHIRLNGYNRYMIAVFLLLVQPFIIVSIVGRLLGWEPIVNRWLGV